MASRGWNHIQTLSLARNTLYRDHWVRPHISVLSVTFSVEANECDTDLLSTYLTLPALRLLFEQVILPI